MDWEKSLETLRKGGARPFFLSVLAVVIPTVLTLSTEAITGILERWQASCTIILSSKYHETETPAGEPLTGRVYSIHTRGAPPTSAVLRIGNLSYQQEDLPLIYMAARIDDPYHRYSIAHPNTGDRCEVKLPSAGGAQTQLCQGLEAVEAPSISAARQPEIWMVRDQTERLSTGAVNLDLSPLRANSTQFIFIETDQPKVNLPARISYGASSEGPFCALEYKNIFNQYYFLNSYQRVLFLALVILLVLAGLYAAARLRRPSQTSEDSSNV